MDKLVQRSIFVILTSLVLFVGCQGAPQVIDEVADPAEIAVTEMATAVPPTPPPTNSPMPLPTQIPGRSLSHTNSISHSRA